MLEPCSPVQGFGSQRRGVEVCGGCCCDFDFVGVLYSVCKFFINDNKIITIIIKINNSSSH